MTTRANLNIRGEIVVSEVSFKVRSGNGQTSVSLSALTQIQMTDAQLVDFTSLLVMNPNLPDTTLGGLPRRSSILFSPTPNDSLLTWIDAIDLADSGFVRLVVGRDHPLGIAMTISGLGRKGKMDFILHRDTEAELRMRGQEKAIVIALEKGALVTATPRKMMQLRGRLEEPQPGYSVSNGIPVRELSFSRSHTEESSKSRSSIVSGRLEFDEDWLNPDRRGEAGEVPGFELEPGDHLQVAAPDLVVNDLEFLMLDDRLHIKLIFSGKADVLKTRSMNKLKDGRLTLAEFFSLHPTWRLIYGMLYEVLALVAGLLSLWWMFTEHNSRSKERDRPGSDRASMRSVRWPFRKGPRRSKRRWEFGP